MFYVIVLTGLASLCLVGLAAAGLLVRRGGWIGLDGAALAAGFAIAPVLTGLIAYLPITMGWTGIPLALFPALAATTILLAVGVPLKLGSTFHVLRDAPAWLAVLIAIATLIVLLQGLTIAVSENDAMEYLIAGRMIAASGGLAGYPFTTADPLTGFYAPSLHPPAFHLLSAWVIGAAPEGSILVLRVTAAMALAATGLAAAHMAADGSHNRASLTLLMTLSTPVLVAMTTSFNADAPRIAALMGALLATATAIARPGVATMVSAGLFCAVAMWAHGAGLMAPGIAVAAFVISGRNSRDLSRLAVFVSVAAVVGGAWYVANAIRFGAALSDSWPAAEWPFLGYLPDMLARRGLETVSGAVANGAMQAFTDPALMGFVFWLALVGMLLSRARRTSAGDLVAAVAVFGFLLAALASAALGRDLVLKNIRYVMTVAPAAAILASAVLSVAIDKAGVSRALARAICVLAVVLCCVSAAIRSSGLSSIAPLLGQPESWAINRERFAGGRLLGQIALKEGDKLLTFRQADLMHRRDLRWIDHFDPTLKDIHTAEPAAAAAALAQRGVRFAYVTSSTPVTVINSAVGQVLGNPMLSEPVSEHRGARLLRLDAGGTAASCSKTLPFVSEIRHRKQGWVDWTASFVRLPQLIAYAGSPEPAAAAPLPITIGREHDASELRLSLATPHDGRFAAVLRLSGQSLFAILAEFVDDAGRSRRLPLLDGLSPTVQRDLPLQWKAVGGERLAAIVIIRPAGQKAPLRLERASICDVAS